MHRYCHIYTQVSIYQSIYLSLYIIQITYTYVEEAAYMYLLVNEHNSKEFLKFPQEEKIEILT